MTSPRAGTLPEQDEDQTAKRVDLLVVQPPWPQIKPDWPISSSNSSSGALARASQQSRGPPRIQ